jgi:1-acyl-sn-glycerol-3-phosphate acyltransferase
LCCSLGEVAARFFLLRLRHGSRLELWRLAHWLNQSCATILRRIGVRVECRGMRPAQGLVVSNHLSYLDILAYSAVMPCVFVAKREVRNWPAFGFFARCGGTIFIDRQNRASTDNAARRIAETLQAGVVMMVFPEGTSTDGSEVLRFHPSLLEPAVQLGVDMTPAVIAYRVRGGEERDACYYGDVHFVPHLLRTLGRAGIVADVEFSLERGPYTDRKTAAVGLRDWVQAMRKRIKRGSSV